MSEKTQELAQQLREARQAAKVLEEQLHAERKKCQHDFIEFELPDLPGRPARVCKMCEKFFHPLGLK